jgi:hypothetical protein
LSRVRSHKADRPDGGRDRVPMTSPGTENSITLPPAFGQQLVVERPALLQDERVVTSWRSWTKSVRAGDWAPPRLKVGKARELVWLQ